MCTYVSSTHSFFKKYFIYLFLERGREGKREGEKHQWGVASQAPPPFWGPGLQPRHVPRLVLNALSHTSQGSLTLLTWLSNTYLGEANQARVVVPKSGCFSKLTEKFCKKAYS